MEICKLVMIASAYAKRDTKEQTLLQVKKNSIQFDSLAMAQNLQLDEKFTQSYTLEEIEFLSVYTYLLLAPEEEYGKVFMPSILDIVAGYTVTTPKESIIQAILEKSEDQKSLFAYLTAHYLYYRDYDSLPEVNADGSTKKSKNPTPREAMKAVADYRFTLWEKGRDALGADQELTQNRLG